jgi:hypothetical protein
MEEKQEELHIGQEISEEDRFKKILYKLQKKIAKNGFYYFFDIDGKNIAKGMTGTETHKKLLRRIKNDPEIYDGKDIIRIDILFLPDYVMTLGGMKVYVEVLNVRVIGQKVFIGLKDKDSSILQLYYKHDELQKFAMDHLKKIAVMMIQKRMGRVGPFHDYYLQDVEPFFD